MTDWYGEITGEQPQRQRVTNPDGSISTERSITVVDPRLNQGMPTNIPSMYGGKDVPQNEAIEMVVNAGGNDPETGRKLQGFPTINAAVDAARARSESLGKTVSETKKPMNMLELVNSKLAERGYPQPSAQPQAAKSVDWYSEVSGEEAAVAAPQELDAPEQGFFQSVKSAITGEGRKDPNIPEFDIPFEFTGRQAKTALGLMTTFDDKREMEIYKENYPDLKFSEDEQGNILVDGSAYGGEIGYLNKPGISIRDIADVGFQIVAFTPAGKAGALVTKTVPRMAAVGVAAGVTQAALDVAGQAAGATEEVALGNIEKSDVLLATVGGAAFEAIGVVAAKMLPSFKKKAGEITDKIRQEFHHIAKKQGVPVEQITDDVIQQFVEMAEDSVDFNAMGAVQASKEFGIPYTKGQTLDDIKQLGLEDTMRHGGAGAKAEETMKAFQEGAQKPAIKEAVAKTQVKIARGEGGIPKPALETPVGMGEAVREGVKREASLLEEAVSEAYEAVGDAYLSPESMGKLASAVIKASKEFVKDSDLTPATMKFLAETKKFQNFIANSGAKIKPTHIDRIDTMRKKIGSYIAAAKNPTDKRQMVLMKKQFDNFLDDAVDQALFSGDEGAMEALKQARGLRAAYAKKFQRQDVVTKSGRKIKDEAGEVMERLISADPTDEQVVNYIFGASKVGGKQAGSKVAKRLKETMGPDSPEWQSVREAAFLKLTAPAKGQDVTSGRVFLSRLDELERDAPTMMKELFSKEEIGLMRRLSIAIKKAQPDPKNPSKTSYKMAAIAEQYADNFLRLMGWSLGGIKGRMTAETVIKGKGFLGSLRAAKEARAAVQGVSKPLKRLSVGQVGAPAAVAAGE